MKTKLKTLGLTGPQYVQRLNKKSYNVSSWAEDISKQIPKSKKTSYNIVIIKASEFTEEYPTTQEIRDEAKRRGYITPPAELAFILREQFSDKDLEEMGLWWLIVIHEPITDSGGRPRVLGLHRGDGGRWLGAFNGRPTRRWYREFGFGFLAPKVSPKKSEPLNSLDPLSLESRVSKIEDWIKRVRNQLL